MEFINTTSTKVIWRYDKDSVIISKPSRKLQLRAKKVSNIHVVTYLNNKALSKTPTKYIHPDVQFELHKHFKNKNINYVVIVSNLVGEAGIPELPKNVHLVGPDESSIIKNKEGKVMGYKKLLNYTLNY